jgi:hypothetical protein
MPKESKKEKPFDGKFDRRTSELRAEFDDSLRLATKEHGRKLDFGGYLQARDTDYLGIIRGSVFAKPFGNDSSNVQAVIGGLSYWKRVCYREEPSAVLPIMKSVIENLERPKFEIERNEPLTFNNTLSKKYGRFSNAFPKKSHRSSKAEMSFMMSTYFRNDRDLVILRKP